MASSSSPGSPPHQWTSPCDAEATTSGMRPRVRLAERSGLTEPADGIGDWVIPRVGRTASFTMFKTAKNKAQHSLDKRVADYMADMTSATAGIGVDCPTASWGEAGGGGAGSGVVSAAASRDLEVTTATADEKEAEPTSGGWLETKQVSPLAVTGGRNSVEADGSAGGGGASDGGRSRQRSSEGSSGRASMTATALTNASTAAQGRGDGGGDDGDRRPGLPELGAAMATVASPSRTGTVIRSGDLDGYSGTVPTAASGDVEVVPSMAETKANAVGDASGGWPEVKNFSPQPAAGNHATGTTDGMEFDGGGRHLQRSRVDTGGRASMTATALTNADTAAQDRRDGGGGDGDRRPGLQKREAAIATVASSARAGTSSRSGDVDGCSGTVPTAAKSDLKVAAETVEGKKPGDKNGGGLDFKERPPEAAAGSVNTNEASGPAGGGHMGDGGRRMRSDGAVTATAPMNAGIADQGGRCSAGGGKRTSGLPIRDPDAAKVASPARAGTIVWSGGSERGNTSGGGGGGGSLLPVGVGKSSAAAGSAAQSDTESMATRGRSRVTASRDITRSVPTSQAVDDTAAALSAQGGAASPRGGPGVDSGGKGEAARSLLPAGAHEVAPSADGGTSSCSNGTKMATRGRKAVKNKDREGSKKRKIAGAAKPSAASLPPLANDNGLSAVVSSEAERLTCAEIKAHIASLDTGIHPSQETIQNEGRAILESLGQFVSELETKTKIRKHGAAMTGKIKCKLSKTEGGYHELEDFAQDVDSVYTYFVEELQKESEHGAAATRAKAQHQTAWLQALERMKDIEYKRSGDLCSLCQYEKRSFEPPAVFCDGANCKLPQKRIPRKAPLHHYPGSDWHICDACFERAGDRINVLGRVVGKTALLKKANDEIPEETMVECGVCRLWMHETCALYNPYPSGEAKFFECPNCILQRRKRDAGALALASPLRAQGLPHGEVSRAMEEAVQKSLLKAYQATAEEEGISLDEVVKVTELHIREVSVVDTVHVVDEKIRQHVGSEGTYPSEFPVRERCLAITQGRHGSDVFVLILYTFEYGHTSPSPNWRRVLISYLDTVNLLEPRRYRSTIYKEALTAYLANVKERGFHTAHIWSSAPTKGDNYVFNVRPSNQRVSSNHRLLKWYGSLLDGAQERGIVLRRTNLLDEYWPAGSGGKPSNLCALPYLKGDYWIEKALMLIKPRETSDWPATVPAAQVSTSTSTTAGVDRVASREAARRRAKPGETTTIDGPKRKGAPRQQDTQKKSKRSAGECSTTVDPVMAKLGKAIAPIKSTFIVAHLRPSSFVREMQTRREREMSIEAARVAVETARANDQEPDVEDLKMAAETIRPDETMDAKIVRQGTVFDDRESFLSFCIKKCFQFNTWRHAKYASAMLLHFLKHPEHMPGKEARAK